MALTNDFKVKNGLTVTDSISAGSCIEADSFEKHGGTSSQFLKADGSVDSSAYTTCCGDVTGIDAGTAITITDGNTSTPAVAVNSTCNSTWNAKTTCTGTVTSVAGCTGITVNNGTGSACVCVNAAQPTITSLGNLTCLVVDDITLNDSLISNAGQGHLCVCGGGDIALDSTNGDIKLRDASTDYGRFLDTSNNFIIQSLGNNKDLIFCGVDNGSNVQALRLDMSDAGSAIFNNWVCIGAGSLKLGGTAVTSTATELNLLDGFSSIPGACCTGTVTCVTTGPYLTGGGATTPEIGIDSACASKWDTAAAGDISAVTAGTGMTGGGTSGDVTLNVIGGDGITANADNIVVDSTVVRTSGTQSIAGSKTFTSIPKADGLNVRSGQQLVLNAGESVSYATGQTAENVYINAESGLIVSSSPDNWASGWAGRKESYINNTSGNSNFANNITLGGTVDGRDVASDGAKLDGIACGANNYSLPEATATVRGGIELFSNTDQSVAANAVTSTASRTYGIQLNSSGQAVVNVPWCDNNSGGTVTSIATGTGIGGGTITGSGTLTVGAGTGLCATADGLCVATACNTAWNAKTTCTGTVTSVTGGDGLTGTVTSSGSLNVGAGTAITVAADTVGVTSSCNTAWNAKTTCTGTVTSVTAGTGMTQSGTSTVNPTLNVIGGTGITANANDIALTTAGAGAGAYGCTADNIKIDTICLDAYGRVTCITTGGTGCGDITAVVAGTGMTGGATSGSATLNVIGGEGITANANDIAVDSTVARTNVDEVFSCDLTVNGDLTVTGDITCLETIVSTTSALSVVNNGSGPAITVNQTGSNDIIDFRDDGTSVFYIEDGGNVGIGTTDPTVKLQVQGDITLNSANPAINFNGTSDTGIDMQIYSTPEGLDFREPEDGNKIHFRILDDVGVDAPFGYKVNGNEVINCGRCFVGAQVRPTTTIADAYISSAACWNACATSTQGTKADNALPKAGGTMSGAIAMGNNNITGVNNIQANGDLSLLTCTGEYAVYGTANAQTQLYHNGLKKFETASGGVVVTGGGTFSNSVLIDYTGSDTAGRDAGLRVQNDSSDWGIRIAKDSYANFGLRVDSAGGNAIALYCDASTNTFNVNGSTGSITTAGDVNVCGGDIILGGTGRIQGIDTVSASTDAANKNYVDTCIAAVPTGDITAVVAGDGLTGGATSGSATLDVGAGTAITVAADTVSVNSTCNSTWNAKTTCTGTVTSIATGTGIGGGTITGSGSLTVGAGTGLCATADGLCVATACNTAWNAKTTCTGTVDTSGTPVDNDFAKFTDANTIEGRSCSEVRSDLGIGTAASCAVGCFLSINGCAANSALLDSIDSSQFLRSDTADTASGTVNFSGDICVGDQIFHTGDSDTYLQFVGANDFRVVTGARENLRVKETEVVINEASNDVDFRVESNSCSSMLFVDGGNNRVGIGTSSPSATLAVNGSFTATCKSFLVDNPVTGGQLKYGVVEGNEHGVTVRGSTCCGTIDLPAEWDWLVEEDSVTAQITPVGSLHTPYIVSQDNKQVVVCSSGCYNYNIYGTRKDVEPLEVNIL